MGQTHPCPLFHPGAAPPRASQENRGGYWERRYCPLNYFPPRYLCTKNPEGRREGGRPPQPTATHSVSSRHIHLGHWSSPRHYWLPHYSSPRSLWARNCTGRWEARRQPHFTPINLDSSQYIHSWASPPPNAAIPGFHTRHLREIQNIIWALMYSSAFPWHAFTVLLTTWLENTSLRVPTFYAPPTKLDDGHKLTILVACVSIVFGSIHCIAWSFHFATLQKWWVWKISATLISGLPISAIALVLLLTVFEDKENKTIWIILYNNFMVVIIVLMCCSYIIARIALLMLPFVALCALPPGIYVQLD